MPAGYANSVLLRGCDLIDIIADCLNRRRFDRSGSLLLPRSEGIPEPERAD